MEQKQYRIALIPGDGIGPEVIAGAVTVMNRIAELDERISFSFDSFPWGCKYFLEHGVMMPEHGIAILKEYDAVLLGAVGDPEVPDHISLRDLLLKIRHEFDQYINLRPVKLLNGAPCPLKDKGSLAVSVQSSGSGHSERCLFEKRMRAGNPVCL